MSERVATALKIWIPLAFVITVICGLVYLAVQQDMRSGANDPQIQIAEDGAKALADGGDPKMIIPQGLVKIDQSLSPFIIVYNDAGLVTGSSALLNEQTPVLPTGVFLITRQTNESRFTWQPEPNVRVAAVLTHFDGPNAGFVLAGRSLREVEIRESRLTEEVFGTWVIALGGLFVILLLRKPRS